MFRRIIFSKVPITVLLIILQVVWFFAFFTKLSAHAAWIQGLFTLLGLLMYLFIISSDENPSYQIAWITVIAVLPILGGFLYLILGNKRPAKRMKRAMQRSMDELRPHLDQVPPVTAPPSRMAGVSAYIRHYGPYPAYEGTDLDYFSSGEDLFEEMMTAIERAERFIFFEYFIVSEGEMYRRMAEVLTAKARAGLDVRVMYDGFGCITTIPRHFERDLKAAGVQVVSFNPLIPLATLKMNHRDHRKLLIVDGHIGFTGGINIADEYINRISRFGYWKDTGVRLSGPAVWSMTLMFLHLWHYYRPSDEDVHLFAPTTSHEASDGLVQPFSDTPLDGEALAKNIYMDILWRAEKYVTIMNPYWVPDNEMMKALTMAAKRGVQVTIIVPGINDSKSVALLAEGYYKKLLEAGVHIHAFTPGFVHAKSMVSDDCIAVVGTVNMDFRSLYLHFEDGVLFTSESAVAALKRDGEETLKQCRPLKISDLRQGVVLNLIRAMLRIFSPLL
ncbi:MAG: cardiolipin synthase [Eubacteriales bacterium]|nr:cardiolipin synthase [Eubacteriales bacterium]